MQLWNYRIDRSEEVAAVTDATVADFLPRQPGAMGLYGTLRATGVEASQALLQTLEQYAGAKALPSRERPPAGDPNTPALPPYQRHSETSRAAAESIRESAATQERRVWDWFLANGPATDEEMMTAMGFGGNSGRPRRIALVEKGLMRDSGRKTSTRSGRQAVVWECIPGKGYF